MMGESTACLMRSFSQPSSSCHAANEGVDPLRALTSSVSFGRYMTESLAWEKWSTFTHNRYMEEVEKCSKPGSVAEMKAYFEAHYKRKAADRAAALLEQKIAAANSTSKSITRTEIENDSVMDQYMAREDNHVAIVDSQGEEALKDNIHYSVEVNVCTPSDEGRELEDARIEEAEQPILVENRIEQSNQLENVENAAENMSNQENKIPVKGAATLEGSASSGKKKPAISTTNSRDHSAVPKPQAPSKPTVSLQKRKNINASPNFENTASDSANRKRAPSRSRHMSIDFGSHETKKPLSPILEKIVNSRLVRTLARASKDNTTQETPSRASVNISKRPVTPRQGKSRSQTPLDGSISGIGEVERKSRSPCTGSKSPRASGRKERSPIVSYPFSFKSEERAAKRKEFLERLEQKLKAKETEKEQLQAKSKERARNDYKDLHLSATSKSEPNSKFSHETKSSSYHPMKKVPPTRPCSPNLGRKTTSKVQDKNYRPPWRLTS